MGASGNISDTLKFISCKELCFIPNDSFSTSSFPRWKVGKLVASTVPDIRKVTPKEIIPIAGAEVGTPQQC